MRGRGGGGKGAPRRVCRLGGTEGVVVGGNVRGSSPSRRCERRRERRALTLRSGGGDAGGVVKRGLWCVQWVVCFGMYCAEVVGVLGGGVARWDDRSGRVALLR
jgi:hypothetical protein